MRVHHIALRTARRAQLVHFYRELFELEVVSDTTRSTWLRGDGDVVLMVEDASPEEPFIPPGSLELVAFARDPALEARATRLGVTIEARTEHTLYMRDPDGRRVGASSYPFGPVVTIR